MNPLAALFDGIPGFEANSLEELLRDFPVLDLVCVPVLSCGGETICLMILLQLWRRDIFYCSGGETICYIACYITQY